MNEFLAYKIKRNKEEYEDAKAILRERIDEEDFNDLVSLSKGVLVRYGMFEAVRLIEVASIDSNVDLFDAVAELSWKVENDQDIDISDEHRSGMLFALTDLVRGLKKSDDFNEQKNSEEE